MSNNNSEKYIKAVQSRQRIKRSNTPTQYVDRGEQYFKGRTDLFVANRAYLSSDYVTAEVQGLTEDFYAYTTANIRLADISSTLSLTRLADDYKTVLFVDDGVDYCPLGAKLNAMGSVWLVLNPANMSTAKAKCIVGRCNASYNSYDDYGNVVTEPIIVSDRQMSGNDNISPKNIVLPEGYYNVTCQLNENTKRLHRNRRIVLGSKVYYITGFSDFLQEFTGDRESTKLLTMTVRLDEATENDDIMNNFIADGISQKFTVEINGNSKITANDTERLIPHLLVNGFIIEPTIEKPQTFLWSSSNEDVATVDENGTVTGVGIGSAIIGVYLSENPSLVATLPILVVDDNAEPYISFEGLIPASVLQYDTMTVEVAYYEGGEKTTRQVNFAFSGASPNAYTATVNGNSVAIYCVTPSDTPLTITASVGAVAKSITVDLDGY